MKAPRAVVYTHSAADLAEGLFDPGAPVYDVRLNLRGWTVEVGEDDPRVAVWGYTYSGDATALDIDENAPYGTDRLLLWYEGKPVIEGLLRLGRLLTARAVGWAEAVGWVVEFPVAETAAELAGRLRAGGISAEVIE